MTWRKWHGIDIVISYRLPSSNPKSSGFEAIAGFHPLVDLTSRPRVIDLLIRPCLAFAFAVYTGGAFFSSFLLYVLVALFCDGRSER
jgi:hypothetical protein